MSTYIELFEKLWTDYISITPSAKRVHDILSTKQEHIVNDHVAFRTFDDQRVCLDQLSKHFLKIGYKECGSYEFVDKKLNAKHFEHPEETAPKIFISELQLKKCSPKLQSIVQKLLKPLTNDFTETASFLHSGAPWKISYEDYSGLLEESEYAAWLSAWGYHANHFTVSINHLENYSDIASVNDKLKSEGFKLNSTGGEIKGTPELLLEQSSTMADKHTVEFADCTKTIPSCFYEFALRYPDKSGNIFTGFVAGNADKIFSSTNIK